MIELRPLQAAIYLGCSLRWLEMLRSQEILSSYCLDELRTYKEKRDIIHDLAYTDYLRFVWQL